MTTLGFFSVTSAFTSKNGVKGKRRKGWTQVRARSIADLNRLLTRFGSKTKIISTMKADYPFRIVIKNSMWSEWIRQLAADANEVQNFKGAITDQLRHATYFRVWQELMDIEREPDSGVTQPEQSIWKKPQPLLLNHVDNIP